MISDNGIHSIIKNIVTKINNSYSLTSTRQPVNEYGPVKNEDIDA